MRSVLSQFTEVLGQGHVLTHPNDTMGYTIDARRRYVGAALCIVRPGSTADVSRVVGICAAAGLAVVPQGGNTGMCGGATPVGRQPAVVVSLERMTCIRDLDVANSTITVDAGCRLASVQQAAAQVGKLFPMSLGSEGSCQIGGNIATNAGGTAVLRYGNMRDLVLGIEAVLPDGRIWNGLRRLRKDNTGYDLKHLFIGSEGTLGIITGATLKLFAQPRASQTVLAALASIDDVLALLDDLRRTFGEHITTFEAMSQNQYALALRSHTALRDPLSTRSPWYAFIEITHTETANAQAALEEFLSHSIAQGRMLDATLVQTLAQSDNIWHIRHGVTEANLSAGACVSHDTSVPVSQVPEFVKQSEQQIKRAFPDAEVYFVGHVGDGNIHVIAIFPRNRYPDAERFSVVAGQINEIIDQATLALDGSISAEHGIGKSNRTRLRRHKDPIELEFMDAIKAVFDPKGIMNPGTLL